MSAFDEITRIHKDLEETIRKQYSAKFPDGAVFADEIISETIDELSNSLKAPLERQIDAIESIADSAKKTANKADVKGWIAIIISSIALFFEFAVNHTEILDFVKSLFNH
ncbi:MAG: hypothetical protein ACI4SQ_04220 [Eubacterium sp.]